MSDEDSVSRRRYLRLSREDRALLKTYCCEHGMAWAKSASPIAWGRTIYEMRQLKNLGETAQTRAHITCPYPKRANSQPDIVWWEDFDWQSDNPWPDEPIDMVDDEPCVYCYGAHASILDRCEVYSRIGPFQTLMEASCPLVKEGEPLTRWELFAINDCQVPRHIVLQSRIPAQIFDQVEARRKARQSK